MVTSSTQIHETLHPDDPVVQAAQDLAQHHAVTSRPGQSAWLTRQLQAQEAILRATYHHFAGAPKDELALSYAAEWLLDNFYVVQQALRLVREDMPASFYRELPKLADPAWAGKPRVYAIVLEIIRLTQGRLDIEQLQHFVQAYQQVHPLTTGELWALPPMLRLGLLAYLAEAFRKVTQERGAEMPAALEQVPWPEEWHPDDVVANAILSLRLLATQDWKVFVEKISIVEQILRDDPAGIYASMDFDTRDWYRKVVEQLARAGGLSEAEVAHAAIRLAQRSARADGGPGVSRSMHVGFYLIDRGRPQLEAFLGYRPAWSERLGRWCLEHPTLVYLGSITLVAGLILWGLLAYAMQAGAGWLQGLAVVLLGLVPALTMAVGVVNFGVTHLVPPRLLPKLDFESGIPADFRTMVVVPSLLTTSEEVDSLLQQLERHYLGNQDPHLSFALLTDFADAPQQHMPEDEVLLARAEAGIHALNRRYRRPGPAPFYLFHRERRWNPGEGVWMGWERKRGKLEEFNRLILQQGETSYVKQVGDLSILPEIRFVITLDADTVLPRGCAHKLVGTLAHLLNRPEFDPQTGRVVAGYTVLQPRVEIKPTSANQTWFSRIFAGDVGLDLYTRAVSDVYQDLFGEGIYAGKGIYDVAAFHRSLAGRIPENALLSHDLFEGIHGRAGLVTDIILLEDYPPSYLVYAHRTHRWIRGDWQLLPWLLPRVPHAGSGKIPNPLSVIDRWKILDNLRRSLVQPTLLALLVAGWVWLPGSALVWTVVGLMTPAMVLLTGLFTELIRRLQDRTLDRLTSSLRIQAFRWVLSVVFLPYEALIALDAIGSTLVRLLITHRNMLQWTTAAHTVRLFGRQRKVALVWRRMLGAPLLALVLAVWVGWANPAVLPVALPLLVLWFLSPQVAHWISQPIVQAPEPLTEEERRQLRCLARRTWLYFEQFVGPDDHWLPPDHFQEWPRGLVAHRTSPTNIGLLLLSTLSAYDLGYVGVLDLAVRLHDTFAGMAALQRARGHLLNWYDTSTLEPLPPRYISTVDSGNLAACLITLRHGLSEIVNAPVLHQQRWEGLLDAIGVLDEVVAGLALEDAQWVTSVQETITQIRQRVQAVANDPSAWSALLVELEQHLEPALGRQIADLITQEPVRLDVSSVRSLRAWLGRVQHHVRSIRRELEWLVPWCFAFEDPPALVTQPGVAPTVQESWQALVDALPLTVALNALPQACHRGQNALARLQKQIAAESTGAEDVWQEALQWCQDLARNLRTAAQNAESLLADYRTLIQQAEEEFQAMDFRFLFDAQRKVFHIGYHVDSGTLDNSYYDLLASEARTASLVAIAKGDIPQSHWLHLSRPLTLVRGMRVLLSWSGTMFEYLMPHLVMHQYPNTLLDQSNHAAVEHQIAYAREHGIPWGISESGFYQFDANMNYQYRAFGVPGLGLKRGLGDDLVVSPYASLLALSLRPKMVLQNLQRLVELGMLGQYGLYEAIDYTRSRLPAGRDHAIVQSFMVHHQGMILLSLTNYLRQQIMLERFHADPRIQSVDLLLQERIPEHVPLEEIPVEETAVLPAEVSEAPVTPWSVSVQAPFPQAHLLSNGRLGVVITSAGSGYSYWQDVDLTRWRADTTLDDWGMWVYLLDEENRDLWSIGYQPTAASVQSRQVFFHPHKAEFHCQKGDVAAHMEVTVPPEEDVEIRWVRLTNQSDQPRRVWIASYAELVLAAQDADRRHPAFNKLFIESSYDTPRNALVFRRRPRSAEETPIYVAHSLVVDPSQSLTRAYETDRARFLGRSGSPRQPTALTPTDGPAEGPQFTGSVGATLDPIMALGQAVELAPHTTVQIAFLTSAAQTRQEALALVEHYHDWGRIERAFELARSQIGREMHTLDLSSAEMERFQQLLSLLLYPHAVMRADPVTLAANTKGQPGLWPFAISGDYPILLVRIAGEEELPLVREALRAHIFWRQRNLKVDLVILNQRATGYAQEIQAHLQRLLARTNSNVWLNQRGGIFLLQAGLMSEADQVLLATVARVILDGNRGSLADQMRDIHERPARLPAFVPTRASDDVYEPTPPVERPKDLLFDNGLGGFTPDGREYVVYLTPGQKTPAPWINVVANPEFGFLVSEAGSGYTWAINSGENRLTPWHNDPLRDLPGEALYLRDEETAAVWSPTPLPAGADAPYLVRHGIGYTIFEHQSHGLRQTVRLFVAPDDPVKIVQVRLENLWNRVRRITATYYAEWVLGVNRDTMQPYVVPAYDETCYALLARNPYNVEFADRVAFVAPNKQPHGLTADRMEFLGRMGTPALPAALTRIGLASTVMPGLDPCAAIQLHIDLHPGQYEDIYFLIGEGENREQARALVQKYQDPAQVAMAWEKMQARWEERLGSVAVRTPEPAMDLLLNRWLLYQTLACRVWGRSALYQSSGAFGFRDQLQDVMAVLWMAPELTREHILRAARHQFEAGDVLHWWHPPSGRGVRTRISDDLLWLPFVTAHYVMCTGDRSILTEEVPFLQGEPLRPDEEERYGLYEATAETYTLYEHCRRAIQRASTAGPHGLPLMGAGDWNDGMNRVGIKGRGESVWLGWFLYATLKAFAPICEMMGDVATAATYRQEAEKRRQALETHGWDGDWYLRAYFDDGTPLGSAQNLECQIDAIAQSWAVLSGAGDLERVERAMAAVNQHLVRFNDQLVLLFTPPFDKSPYDPGYIKGYPPGVRENGGQYTHAAIWTVWAFVELGQGDHAMALFRLLNPIFHSDTETRARRYRVEPYVVAADVYSVAPHTGRGGWTWYTGSAGWMYRLGLEGILGMRRCGDRLRIDPCIPRDWPGYEIMVRWGETSYHIQVDNAAGVNRGVKQVLLDGAPVPEGGIPLLADGQRHQVHVILG